MSYVVFARKWRPQSFDDVVGQDQVTTTLKNAITAHRLAHAYIFAGPRGVGKTSTARILAKSLNCQKGPAVIPCNKCVSCVEITEARSLDVIEIDGASNRGIDDIRALRENVKFSPVQGKFKIYIIDEVHQITSEGFNALLKTLEEPPAHVKFIFATTQPKKILSTIISRCQFLEFKRITNLKIIEQLKRIAASENLKVEEAVFLALAKASDGSLRDAESMLDELVSFAQGDIGLKDAHSILGVLEQEYLLELVNKIIKKDTAGLLEFLDELIEQGKDINQLLVNLIEHYRNLMIAKAAVSNQEKLLDLPRELCQLISAQAREISLENILLGFNALLGAQETARYMDSLRIPLEIALVKLSSQGKDYGALKSASVVPEKRDIPLSPPRNSQSLARNPHLRAPVDLTPPHLPAASPRGEPLSRGGFLTAAVKPKETPENKPLPIQPEHKLREDSDLDLERVKELWPRFVEHLTKVKVSAAHYLEEGSPCKASGSVLTIGFPQRAGFHKESLEGKENHILLEKIWKELLKQDIKINFAVTKEEKKTVSDSPGENEHDDHLLKSTLDTFNGRIVRKS
ncbi:MAG: DNA polymerase III, subunit gamma and tau [Omnitrophica WOR_2 bacterium RIFOXYC2_FULL_45_15]|nr:MAG: DNA polymerase III, subunit gamma and tau [Omnitrophica WOR_2 bacterium RIFOXYC2_FULL_45_15]